MTINILAIGDVVGQTGLTFLKEHLKPLQKLKGVSFTVVNRGKTPTLSASRPRRRTPFSPPERTL